MGRRLLDGTFYDDLAGASSPRRTGLAVDIGRAADALGVPRAPGATRAERERARERDRERARGAYEYMCLCIDIHT